MALRVVRRDGCDPRLSDPIEKVIVFCGRVPRPVLEKRCANPRDPAFSPLFALLFALQIPRRHGAPDAPRVPEQPSLVAVAVQARISS